MALWLFSFCTGGRRCQAVRRPVNHMLEPLMLELRHFVDCVRENHPSQVPGSDGLRALQLAETVTNEVAR